MKNYNDLCDDVIKFISLLSMSRDIRIVDINTLIETINNSKVK